MKNLTAEQKIRQRLTGDPYTDPNFQHDGIAITRWLTGGIAPSTHVNLQQKNDQIIAFCPQCGKELGQFDADYGYKTPEKIAKIREEGSKHQQQHLEESNQTP